MEFQIKKLTKDLVDDYIYFFDTENHSDNQDEHKCYCVCWCSDDHRTGLDKMSSASKRRALAKEYISQGMIKGYLAYDKEKVVGWVNANDKSSCINCISWLINLKEVNTSTSKKVKSVFCFTVASLYRRKGVATQLLQRVIQDAREDGYEEIEAYPKKEIKHLDDFEGPLSMYLKQGLVIKKEFIVNKSHDNSRNNLFVSSIFL
ncbi:MAG TPA: GNAT family N-acetyltransferase [Bacillota bacterium]|nr:GNAT family N-acetyltransferase [Bacillota bacterium]